MSELRVSASDAMKRIKLTVSLEAARTMRWCIWLGTKIFVLGAWVIGCGLEVKVNA